MKSFGSGRMVFEGSLSFKRRELETYFSFRASSMNEGNTFIRSSSSISIENDAKPLLSVVTSKKNENTPSVSRDERFQAALRLQKVYKSFRTRRQLADCAVLVEQRWWKLLDFAELKRSSISFFDIDHPESAVSRWSRATTRVAKVGKGLSKDERARKLALQHWLEAIDPRHRYGHNLQFYYVNWLQCQSKQPFFYWLDIGEGKEVSLVERCPRAKLQQQCIKYLGPKERRAYEVVVEEGKFYYMQSGQLIDTREGPEDVKWIFVLSTSKTLYVGLKQKGTFQHSSFLAGGATLSAGRLVVEAGVLKAVWPHSGHYLPTNENFEEFMSFLKEQRVDLSIVQKSPTEEEEPQEGKKLTIPMEDYNANGSNVYKTNTIISRNARLPLSRFSRRLNSKITALEIPKKDDMIKLFKQEEEKISSGGSYELDETSSEDYETADEVLSDDDFELSKPNLFEKGEKIMQRIDSHKGMKLYQLAQRLSCKWSTGAGPRIGCVRDYPWELQNLALEEVHLSPRAPSGFVSSTSQKFRRSPRVLTPTGLCREMIPPRSPVEVFQSILPQIATP